MSMLAGPRRKQKVINLRAKNNAWSNDTNKFGQRMLEKMGWSSGKGLGANENGIVEHVVAKYKNDEKGLGFEDKNDQWTKHEDDFNALLANLSNADGDSVQLHSGISLENKSKKSKARVHYHKFTRGKDISRYSEKDLANIFGKKSFKKEEKVEETLTEDIKTTEQVFTEKGSMDDYFKNKLAALKLKNKISLVNSDENNQDCEDYGEHVFQGFSSNNDEINTQETTQVCGFQPFSFYNTQLNFEKENETSNVPESIENGYEDLTTNKKKKKKSKHQHTDLIENICDDETSQKKKRKLLDDNNDVLKSDEISESQQVKVKKSKKKKYKQKEKDSFVKDEASKKKSKTQDLQTELIIEDVIATENDYVPKKKKKTNHKDIDN